MSNIIFEDPAFEGMAFWYSIDCYDKFEGMGAEKAEEAAKAAGDISLENPLLMRNKKGDFDKFEIPHFGTISGPYCAILMASFLVWSQIRAGIREFPTSVLLESSSQAYTQWETLRAK